MDRSPHLVLACVIVLLSACSSVPQDAEVAETSSAVAPSTEVAQADQSEEDPVICKSVMRTGSRVAERRCMRKSVMERQERGGQSALEDWQRRGTHTGNQSTE